MSRWRSRREASQLARYAEERRRQTEHPPVLDDERWNHQIHYHHVVLDAVPAGARRALDVGCGEGLLTRRLAVRVDSVTGLDRDEPSIALARSSTTQTNVDYLVGDLLQPSFADESFDVVVCSMALHHVDVIEGLRCLAAMVEPGGLLGIIGLARSSVADLPWDAAGFVTTRAHRLTKQEWVQPAPMCWPVPDTYADVRKLATRALPGVRYRRHVLFRYSLLWTKPS